MSAFRLKSPDLAYQGDFQAEHQARIDRPLDDIDLDEFLMDVQDNVRPGDWVNVVAYRDRNWDQVMEMGRCIVVSQNREGPGFKRRTRAVWIGDFTKVPKEAVVPDKPGKERKLDLKKEFGGGYTVQDDKGAVIERFKTKQEGLDYIDRISGKAKAA